MTDNKNNNNNKSNNNDTNQDVNSSEAIQKDLERTANCEHNDVVPFVTHKDENGKYDMCEFSSDDTPSGRHEAGDSAYGTDQALMCNDCQAIICKNCYVDYVKEGLSPLDQFELRDLISIKILNYLNISLSNIGAYLIIACYIAVYYNILSMSY